MRLQSKSKVLVRGKIIGGEKPLLCLPLTASDRPGLLKQAGVYMSLKPDLLEWRADYLQELHDMTLSVETLRALREKIGEIPLVFTCRHHQEGGFQEMPEPSRVTFIKKALKTGCIDIVDYELLNGEALIGEVKEATAEAQRALILSYHNFQETPEEAVLLGKLSEAKTLGADIAKLAVMPRDYGDVLKVLNVTYRARVSVLDIPLITMSMGELGAVSRIAGGLFGSDISFAKSECASAPGQIPVAVLRKAWEMLAY